MPRHEIASAVDSTSLLDVFHEEVAKLVQGQFIIQQEKS